MEEKRFFSKSSEGKPVEMIEGIFRTTMSYNKQIMLCHFNAKKGAKIPLHNHVAAQNGYIIKGKIKFFKKDGSSIIVETGDGYVFDSEEYHGSEVLEDSEFIECFTPMRPEYMD